MRTVFGIQKQNKTKNQKKKNKKQKNNNNNNNNERNRTTVYHCKISIPNHFSSSTRMKEAGCFVHS